MHLWNLNPSNKQDDENGCFTCHVSPTQMGEVRGVAKPGSNFLNPSICGWERISSSLAHEIGNMEWYGYPNRSLNRSPHSPLDRKKKTMQQQDPTQSWTRWCPIEKKVPNTATPISLWACRYYKHIKNVTTSNLTSTHDLVWLRHNVKTHPGRCSRSSSFASWASNTANKL